MRRRLHAGAASGAMLLVMPTAVAAQDTPRDDERRTDDGARRDDILVTGKRLPGSVIGGTEPVAVLDAAAIRALGVTSISDMLRLLKPLTTSASGSEPVLLLNGRRISGYGELSSLPPEAIERTEILPEKEAARFGFPATVRVMNFITKAHFRALTIQPGVSTTTDGGATSTMLEATSTRLDGPRRTTVSVAYTRQDPLRAVQRPTTPDGSVPFDIAGNIGAVGGGSIDPALDALAGRSVALVGVPVDAAARNMLAGYAAGRARVTDLSPYQSIASRDTVKVNATQAVPIGAAMASLNLSMDAQGGVGDSGLASATLRVPAGNSASPFGRDVLLYRYLPEAGALRLRTNSLALHAGSTVQGMIRRWQWSVTGSYDRNRVVANADQGVALGAVQAAIDAGGDPFGPLSPAQTANRLVNRSRSVTGTIIGKATANGPVAKLPAGDAQMTLTVDYARSNSAGLLLEADRPPIDLTRVAKGASVAVDMPIASAERGVLGAIGTLSAHGSIGVSSVSNYGSLASSNLAITWTPVRPLQFTASINVAQTPPDIALLTNPVVTVPNVPFFDFVTDNSALVTVSAGGNAGLTPERRRITTLGVGLKPIRTKELRFNLDYIETRITDQTGNLGSVTPALQAAFPDRFTRDARGRLLTADLRPVNVAAERERKVQARVSLWMQLGREPTPAPEGAPAKDAPPPPPPKPRPGIYTFVTFTGRIDDRLMLQPGQPLLDLLGGDSFDGTGGRPRFEVQPTIGGSYGPLQGGIYTTWQSATRIRSAIAASDLRFSSRAYLGLYSTLTLEQLAPHAAWAKKTTVQFEVQNILNDRIDVRDRNGVTPYRFQSAFLDPYGRIVKLSARRLF